MKGKARLVLILFVCLAIIFPLDMVLADTSTSGGIKAGVRVRETWELHQGEYDDFATDLHFKLWQKEDKINIKGWEVDISDFTISSSQRGNQPEPWHSDAGGDNGQHAVDVTASGAIIPFCTWVTVKATFWLTAWNTKRLADVSWTKDGAEEKAMPDHGWSIDYPKSVPCTEQFLHMFTVTNDDTKDELNVTGLAFLATMTWFDDLTQIEFSGSYPNFTLAPGQSWSTNITTTGPLYEGHIYFKYSLNGSSGIYSRDWVDHPVTKEPLVGGTAIPINTPGILAPYIISAALVVSAMVSTTLYIIKRKKNQ